MLVELADERFGERDARMRVIADADGDRRPARSACDARAGRVGAVDGMGAELGEALGGRARGTAQLRVQPRREHDAVAVPPDLGGARTRLQMDDRDVARAHTAGAAAGEPRAQPGAVCAAGAGEHDGHVEVRGRLGVEDARQRDGRQRGAIVAERLGDRLVEKGDEADQQDDRRDELNSAQPCGVDIGDLAPAQPATTSSDASDSPIIGTRKR